MSIKRAAFNSVLIHSGVIVFFVFLNLLISRATPTVEKVKIEIREVIKVDQDSMKVVPEIKLQAARPPVSQAQSKKKVFGLSKNTLQGDAAASVQVKEGNTLAKPIDQEKLNPEDSESLPIPVEDYLITQMPRLKSEVRIPYPAEARNKNIEGIVVMEILIDEKGKVRSAEFLEGPGFGLNEAALQAIYQFEFYPAVVDNQPVSVRIRYSYKFVLS